MTISERLLAGFRAVLFGLTDPLLRDFLDGIDWAMPERALAPHPLACLRHLDRAAAIAGAPARPLAKLLAGAGGTLHWGQTYTAADFGQEFMDNYGWLELFGTRGCFASEAAAGGLLLLGPHVTYPDHRHRAEEIYVPLTGGTEWRSGGRDYAARAAGAVIHHPSQTSHAMRTGAEPLLALYLWRGGPLAERSTILEAGA